MQNAWLIQALICEILSKGFDNAFKFSFTVIDELSVRAFTVNVVPSKVMLAEPATLLLPSLYNTWFAEPPDGPGAP